MIFPSRELPPAGDINAKLAIQPIYLILCLCIAHCLDDSHCEISDLIGRIRTHNLVLQVMSSSFSCMTFFSPLISPSRRVTSALCSPFSLGEEIMVKVKGSVGLWEKTIYVYILFSYLAVVALFSRTFRSSTSFHLLVSVLAPFNLIDIAERELSCSARRSSSSCSRASCLLVGTGAPGWFTRV